MAARIAIAAAIDRRRRAASSHCRAVVDRFISGNVDPLQTPTTTTTTTTTTTFFFFFSISFSSSFVLFRSTENLFSTLRAEKKPTKKNNNKQFSIFRWNRFGALILAPKNVLRWCGPAPLPRPRPPWNVIGTQSSERRQRRRNWFLAIV